jgi:hypothetical protein
VGGKKSGLRSAALEATPYVLRWTCLYFFSRGLPLHQRFSGNVSSLQASIRLSRGTSFFENGVGFEMLLRTAYNIIRPVLACPRPVQFEDLGVGRRCVRLLIAWLAAAPH